jgi:hypothetical protein
MIAVQYNGQKMRPYRKPLEDFLNEWEEKLDIPSSDVEVDDDGTALIVRFSRLWTEKPVLLSAFTLFLRVGCQYDGGGIQPFLKDFVTRTKVWAPCDQQYLKNEKAQERIKLMLKGEKDFKQKYSDFKDSHAIHSRSGLMCWQG